MTGENIIDCLRLNIELDATKPHQNIFNYQQLVQEHQERIKAQNVTEPTEYEFTMQIKPKEPEVIKETSRKKKDPEDDYDPEDNFIDDQELFDGDIEKEPTEWDFGFFVWKGQLDFENEAEMKIPPLETISSASALITPEPIADHQKPKNPIDVDRSKPKKKKPEVQKSPPKNIEFDNVEFAEDLKDNLVILKMEAKKSDFTVKKQFPQNLKPLYEKCINIALDHNQYNVKFFKEITSILPYNTFTMRKLATKLYNGRITKIKIELDQFYQKYVELVKDNQLKRFTEELRVFII
jgi:hypothetical protein